MEMAILFLFLIALASATLWGIIEYINGCVTYNKNRRLELIVAEISKALDDGQRERDTLKRELERANQTIANMMSDLSIVRMERQGAVEELEKVAKERDELKCELGKCHAEYDQFIVKHHGMVSKLESILADAKSEII